MSRSTSRPSQGLAPKEQWSTLMHQAQQGDEQAYHKVLSAMVPVLQTFARYKVKDDTIVDDIVQDTLMTVHTLRHTYDPTRPILPWLSTITSARAVDVLRKYNRHWSKELADEFILSQLIDLTPLDEHDQEDHLERLTHLLANLTPSQRHIVQLVKIDELSLNETSEKTGLSVPAVKSLLHRALTKLKSKSREQNES